MKQFNLEEYLKNPNKKVVTRDGRKVKRVLCTNAMGPHPIVVLIEHHNNNNTEDIAIQYTKDGKYFISGMNNKDLFFATERKEGWINIYRTEGLESVYTANVYNSKEEAEDAGRGEEDYLATIKIEWEEQVWKLVELASIGRDG